MQVFDFESNSGMFQNGTMYRKNTNEWMLTNKIYKYGKICLLTLDVDVSKINEPADDVRVLNIAIIPSAFSTLSIAINHMPMYYAGLTPSGLLYASDKNSKYPKWSDVGIIRFDLMYITN